MRLGLYRVPLWDLDKGELPPSNDDVPALVWDSIGFEGEPISDALRAYQDMINDLVRHMDAETYLSRAGLPSDTGSAVMPPPSTLNTYEALRQRVAAEIERSYMRTSAGRFTLPVKP